MGRAYDGKRRWNETVLRTDKAAAASTRPKKTKRFSGRTTKLSKAMRHVDEETRAIVRNARLDALEADNYGADADDAEDGASDDMYVDDDAAGAMATGASKDKKARKSRKPASKTKAKKRWKVKSLAQLVFEELGTGDDAVRASAESTPTYLSVAAAASTRPPRRFCCVCGFFAPYACARCGSRFCRVQCGDQHKESGCLKFGL